MYQKIQPSFGDLFYAELPADGSLYGGKRPVLIAQNNVGNAHSPIVEVIPLSSQIDKARHMPTHVLIPANSKNGLTKNSIVIAEQPRSINVYQLRNRLGSLCHDDLVKVGDARRIQSPFPVSH